MTKNCDHCDKSIELKISIWDELIWCAECFFDNKVLLKERGVFSYSDNYIRQVGYTHWCNNNNLKVLRPFPKKGTCFQCGEKHHES